MEESNSNFNSLFNQLFFRLSTEDRRIIKDYVKKVMGLIQETEDYKESINIMMAAMSSVVFASDVSNEEKIKVLGLFFRDHKDVKRIIESSLDKFGKIDCLLNNAAGNFLCLFENLTPNGWRKINNIVLDGAFNIYHIFKCGHIYCWLLCL